MRLSSRPSMGPARHIVGIAGRQKSPRLDDIDGAVGLTVVVLSPYRCDIRPRRLYLPRIEVGKPESEMPEGDVPVDVQHRPELGLCRLEVPPMPERQPFPYQLRPLIEKAPGPSGERSQAASPTAFSCARLCSRHSSIFR